MLDGCHGFQPVHSKSTTSKTSGCVGVALSKRVLIQRLGIGHAGSMRDGLVFTSVLHVPPQGWEKAMRETASTAVRISVGDCHLGVEDSLFELGGVTICRALAD